MKLCSTEPGMMEDEETPLPVLHISSTALLLPHLRTESLTAGQHTHVCRPFASQSRLSGQGTWYDRGKQSTETFQD